MRDVESTACRCGGLRIVQNGDAWVFCISVSYDINVDYKAEYGQCNLARVTKNQKYDKHKKTLKQTNWIKYTGTDIQVQLFLLLSY